MFTWPTIVWVYWGIAFATLLAYTYVFTYGQITSRRSRLSRHALSFAYALAFAAGGILMVQLLDAARAPPYALGWTNTLWWWVAAALTSAAATLLLGWALFSDPSRGRKRCPRCWYDMADSPTLTCPECGRDARRPDRLLRTRRRPRIAALAVLLNFTAVGLGLWPFVSTHDLDRYTPDWVMLVAMPYAKANPAEPVMFQWPQRLFNERIYDGRAGSLAAQLREDCTPRWKRRLALWSAGACMRSEQCQLTQHMGLVMAQTLGADAKVHAPIIADLCSANGATETQWRALRTLSVLPGESERTWQTAIGMLQRADPECVIWALEVLIALSQASGDRPVPPTQLLALLSHNDEVVAHRALDALGSFATSPEAIAALEQLLEKLQERQQPSAGVAPSLLLREALDALVMRAPDSPRANDAACRLLIEGFGLSGVRLARWLRDRQWAPPEVLEALATWMERYQNSVYSLDTLHALLIPNQHGAQWNRQAILHLGEHPKLRRLLCNAVVTLGHAAEPLLPDLYRMLENWEAEDDPAAGLLRVVIREIESPTPPPTAPPPTPSSSR